MHFESFIVDEGLGRRQVAAVVNGAQRMQAGGGFRYQALPYTDRRWGHGIFRIGHGGRKIGHGGQVQMGVALRRADQSHAAGGGADPFGSALHQQGPFDGQQRFVAPHARAAAAGEDESRRGVHEMILTSVWTSETSRPVPRNKKVYICSLVAIYHAGRLPHARSEPV